VKKLEATPHCQVLNIYSGEVLTESFLGPGFPNEDDGNADDCGVMVVEMDNLWWEDSSCLTQEAHHNTIAVICQYDIDVASTTTTSAASTTSRIPESTTVTTTAETTIGSSCPSSWQEFADHCYLVEDNRVTWAEAENDCNNKGGHLASVHSAAENNFIRSLDSGRDRDLYLGGTFVEVGFTIYVLVH
jgi:hypothetical protein